jgi:hypothetical protein
MDHLLSFNGGSLPTDQAAKHKAQVAYLLENVQSRVEDSKDAIGSIVAENVKSNRWTPSTCRVYLNSLKKFVIYLKLPWICRSGEEEKKLDHLENSIGRWLASLRKESMKEERSSFNDEDMVNPDDISTYFTSDRAAEAAILLKTMKEANQSNHTVVRNFLVMSIFSANFCRAGNVVNMTLTEFSAAKNRNDHYVVVVKKHKVG